LRKYNTSAKFCLIAPGAVISVPGLSCRDHFFNGIGQTWQRFHRLSRATSGFACDKAKPVVAASATGSAGTTGQVEFVDDVASARLTLTAYEQHDETASQTRLVYRPLRTQSGSARTNLKIKARNHIRDDHALDREGASEGKCERSTHLVERLQSGTGDQQGMATSTFHLRSSR